MLSLCATGRGTLRLGLMDTHLDQSRATGQSHQSFWSCWRLLLLETPGVMGSLVWETGARCCWRSFLHRGCKWHLKQLMGYFNKIREARRDQSTPCCGRTVGFWQTGKRTRFSKPSRSILNCEPQSQLHGYHKTHLSPLLSLRQHWTFQEKRLFIVELIVQAGVIYLNVCQ